LKKALVKDVFFSKENKIILSGQQPIGNVDALEQHINEIDAKIQQMPAYKAIENLLSDSKGMTLKDIIEVNPEIIEYLAVDKLIEIYNLKRENPVIVGIVLVAVDMLLNL
jgi:hypothetical protein